MTSRPRISCSQFIYLARLQPAKPPRISISFTGRCAFAASRDEAQLLGILETVSSFDRIELSDALLGEGRHRAKKFSVSCSIQNLSWQAALEVRRLRPAGSQREIGEPIALPF
jgi:hypothetical protein